MGRYGSYGWVRQQPDERDHHYSVVAQEVLPPEVSLRHHMPLIWNQGQLGSCTAHGIGAALEYAHHSAGHYWVRPSRLFVYYNERAMEGTVDQDAGAVIRDGIKCVNTFGAPPEHLWPYETDRFTVKPPATAYAKALKYTALTYHAVNQDAYDLKYALAQGKPVVFGFTVYANFESAEVARTGIVPMPVGQILGGHCVLLVGYRQIHGETYFECRNSWGSSWGDHGYFWVPEAFLTSPSIASDFWVIDSEGPKAPGLVKQVVRALRWHLPGVKP